MRNFSLSVTYMCLVVSLFYFIILSLTYFACTLPKQVVYNLNEVSLEMMNTDLFYMKYFP